MAATPPERSPQSFLGTLIPLLQIGGIILWVLELAAVAFTVLSIPSFAAMHKDLGTQLPAISVLVLNAGDVARSWPGLLGLLALLAGSIVGYWKARDSYTYWGILTVLKVAALLWLGLWVVGMFLPLIGNIKSIK